MRAMMPPITTSNHSTPPIPSAPAPLLHAKAAEETQFNHLRFPAGHLLQPRQRFIQCEQLTAPVGLGDGSSSRLTAVEWRPRANGKVVIFLPSSPRLRAAGPTASRICAGPSGSFPSAATTASQSLSISLSVTPRLRAVFISGSRNGCPILSPSAKSVACRTYGQPRAAGNSWIFGRCYVGIDRFAREAGT